MIIHDNSKYVACRWLSICSFMAICGTQMGFSDFSYGLWQSQFQTKPTCLTCLSRPITKPARHVRKLSHRTSREWWAAKSGLSLRPWRESLDIKGTWDRNLHGYGSIPIDTFLVGWTSIYQLFWGSLGTRVLTHPHMNFPGYPWRFTKGPSDARTRCQWSAIPWAAMASPWPRASCSWAWRCGRNHGQS